MRQKDIEEIAIFPEYNTEAIEDSIYTFRSVIHLHKETEDFVKVYLYPVESTYVAKTKKERELVIRAHLRECFRLSKYLDIKSVDTSPYPHIINLVKTDDDFLEKLHYTYM
jgi:hypothetical protein